MNLSSSLKFSSYGERSNSASSSLSSEEENIKPILDQPANDERPETFERDNLITSNNSDQLCQSEKKGMRDSGQQPSQRIDPYGPAITFSGRYDGDSNDCEESEDEPPKEAISQPQKSNRSLYDPVNWESSEDDYSDLEPSLEANLQQREAESAKDFYWQSRLQKLLRDDDSLEKFSQLSQLSQDFVNSARSYAQIIISEQCFENEQKTIKPLTLGGLAGGEKFIVCKRENIFEVKSILS